MIRYCHVCIFLDEEKEQKDGLHFLVCEGKFNSIFGGK